MENTQSLSEIHAQIAVLQQRAEEIRAAEFAGVVADIKEKIALYGITMAQIGFKDSTGQIRSDKRESKKVNPKFRDSNGNTWSGRGLKPKWLVAAIQAGQTLESFQVESDTTN